MKELYVVTVIGYSAFKRTHDLMTIALHAHSHIEAQGFGVEEFNENYRNYTDIQAQSMKITEDMLKI